MKSIELFPVTVFKSKIINNDFLKEVLCESILESSEELVIPEDWTTDRVKTSFAGEPAGKEVLKNYKSLLEEHYIECISEFFDKEFNFNIDKIWYNIYTDGEYQEVHDHLGTSLNPTHFSLIHFLSFNKDEHKPPEFRDPISQLRMLSLEFDNNKCGEVYVPDVEEGDLLMFPCYLQHCVPPGKKTNYPRITISFNIRVTQYGREQTII
jgi:hypothetical protein